MKWPPPKGVLAWMSYPLSHQSQSVTTQHTIGSDISQPHGLWDIRIPWCVKCRFISFETENLTNEAGFPEMEERDIRAWLKSQAATVIKWVVNKQAMQFKLLLHLLVAPPWASYLTSPCLSFLITHAQDVQPRRATVKINPSRHTKSLAHGKHSKNATY